MRTRALTTPALAALLAALASCGRGAVPARVVRIDSGVADTAEIASLPDWWAGQVPGGRPAAWLAPGAFLLSEAPLQYSKGDGEHLALDFTGWSTRLAGRVVSLDLGKDSAVTWLERASDADLAALRLVAVSPSPPAARPALERLAAANPHVGLSFDSTADMERTLPLFRPRLLAVPEAGRSTARQLAQQPQLETLFLLASDSASLAALRGLPRLRHLVLDDATILQAGQLPAGLEDLEVRGSTLELARLGGLPRLRTLILTRAEWQGATDLAAFPELRWLGLPRNATQTEFAAIILAHPDLEVIQLIDVDSVTDLSPLRSERHLRAVTLNGHYPDLGVLRELRSLEFVGLSKDIWKKSPDQVDAVRAALPGAVIVKVTPLCLGSGWILLIVPAAMLVTLAGRRTRRPRPAAR